MLWLTFSGQGGQEILSSANPGGSKWIHGCGTSSQGAKVAIATCPWYVAVRILGNMQAGLLDKCLGAEEVQKENQIILKTEAHDAMNWETQFQVAKMAKSSAGLSLKAVRATDGIQPPVNVCACAKTPAKCLHAGRRGS
jgi:hypothetical protein